MKGGPRDLMYELGMIELRPETNQSSIVLHMLDLYSIALQHMLASVTIAPSPYIGNDSLKI